MEYWEKCIYIFIQCILTIYTAFGESDVTEMGIVSTALLALYFYFVLYNIFKTRLAYIYALPNAPNNCSFHTYVQLLFTQYHPTISNFPSYHFKFNPTTPCSPCNYTFQRPILHNDQAQLIFRTIPTTLQTLPHNLHFSRRSQRAAIAIQNHSQVFSFRSFNRPARSTELCDKRRRALPSLRVKRKQKEIKLRCTYHVNTHQESSPRPVHKPYRFDSTDDVPISSDHWSPRFVSPFLFSSLRATVPSHCAPSKGGRASLRPSSPMQPTIDRCTVGARATRRTHGTRSSNGGGRVNTIKGEGR